MKLLCGTALALALLAPAWAHDPKLHKGTPVTGEIASVGGDSFELKTKTGAIKVTLTAQTKFEHGKETVDKSHLHKGGRVAVIGTKLPTGELVAKEVLFGLPERGDQAKAAHKH